MPRARTAVATALVAAVLVVTAAEPAAATPSPDGAAVRYRPPVAAPVADPFRPPAHRYGPGNRGIEYRTPRGAVVRAAAPGEVLFAGQVAGRRYVTILHADGVRTTYGPLTRLRVRRGATALAGQPLGTTAGPVLWTARIGDAYVDPAVLVAASGTPTVRLVADRRRTPLGVR